MQLIGGPWSPASISALAAVCGSLVGALGSSVSTWIAQRQQNRRDLLAKKIFHREQLYSDFISETARAMADAMQHRFQDPSRLIPNYALLSRIRLSSSIKGGRKRGKSDKYHPQYILGAQPHSRADSGLGPRAQ